MQTDTSLDNRFTIIGQKRDRKALDLCVERSTLSWTLNLEQLEPFGLTVDPTDKEEDVTRAD